ncbi:hypothetical protein AMATHDRAFT_135571 [Amanita thiersii Skay4041]|uniref:cAMP-independent regulatory protein pac2 n=1 Tax=Amanita thiersii Skay4041 TaxID=703135 RepID=A0A2A9NXE2_9AGAR|nr:hypothetical protein AMATHDRAFT_135571 [Amanita thiersii Skay4041]
MQQATYQRLHVRDAHDAHVLFEAVRQGFLRPVHRRLNELERSTLVRSGAIFVWVESDDEAGLKRWTDGRVWGQSRMREPYLFYDEKLPFDSRQQQVADTSPRTSTYRFVEGVSRGTPVSSAISHHDRCPNPHSGLVKQAYSVWVTPNPSAKPQKWHLTAYFTYADLPRLPTIDRDALLSKIYVPPGIYHSNSRTRAHSDADDARRPVSPMGISRTDHNLPSLSALQEAAGTNQESVTQPRTHVQRLSEDERVIHMLNSRHVR